MQVLAPIAVTGPDFDVALLSDGTQAPIQPGWIRVGNESAFALECSVGADRHWLHPWSADVWPLYETSSMHVHPVNITPAAAGSPAGFLLVSVAPQWQPFPGTYPCAVGSSTVTQLQLQSVSDARTFSPIIDHKRVTVTNAAEYEYSEVQVGRLLYRDGFGSANPQWSAVSGTLAADTATYLKGGQSLKLTAAAGAGNQAIARKFFQLPADQAFSTFPLLLAEVWFKPFDVNWRDIQLFVRPDDTFTKWQAAIRVLNQQAGVAQAQFQYLDSTGTFQNITQYFIRQGGGSVGDAWHRVMVGLNYLQTQPGNKYLTYQVGKYDDETWQPVITVGPTWNLAAPSAQQQATAGFREVAVDLVVTGDNAAASVVHFAEFILADLSNAFQL